MGRGNRDLNGPRDRGQWRCIVVAYGWRSELDSTSVHFWAKRNKRKGRV